MYLYTSMSIRILCFCRDLHKFMTTWFQNDAITDSSDLHVLNIYAKLLVGESRYE